MAVLLILCIATAELLAQEMDPLTTFPTILVTTGTLVNKAVDKAFKKAFPFAKNLKWNYMDKKYLAHFIENDMKHRAIYCLKGYIKYVVSYVE